MTDLLPCGRATTVASSKTNFAECVGSKGSTSMLCFLVLVLSNHLPYCLRRNIPMIVLSPFSVQHASFACMAQ